MFAHVDRKNAAAFMKINKHNNAKNKANSGKKRVDQGIKTRGEEAFGGRWRGRENGEV